MAIHRIMYNYYCPPVMYTKSHHQRQAGIVILSSNQLLNRLMFFTKGHLLISRKGCEKVLRVASERGPAAVTDLCVMCYVFWQCAISLQ